MNAPTLFLLTTAPGPTAKVLLALVIVTFRYGRCWGTPPHLERDRPAWLGRVLNHRLRAEAFLVWVYALLAAVGLLLLMEAVLR